MQTSNVMILYENSRRSSTPELPRCWQPDRADLFARPALRRHSFTLDVERARLWARRASRDLAFFMHIASALEDCTPAGAPHLTREEERPYNPKRLAKVARLLDLTTREKRRLFAWADYVRLPDRCAGHLIARLKPRRTAP